MANEIAVWNETPLGTLCKENGGSIQTGPFGSQLHAEDYKEQGVPIITVEHLGDGSILHRNLPLVGADDYRRLARYVLKTGDLVFSRVGAIDRCARVSEQENGWLFSGRCLRVRLGGGSTDSKYMSFVLNSHEARQWILNHAVGSTMACLNTSILSNLPLRLASPQEQRKIARILTTVDNLIEKTEALIAKYQAIKQGMMHDLFTRGVDSSGQLRPTQQQAPDLYQLTRFGVCPKSWKQSPLSQFADVSGGVTLGRKLDSKSTIELPYLRVANVQDGYLDLDEMKTVEVLKSEAGKYKLEPGDVVMTEGGDFDKLGRGTIWEGQIADCLHQNHVFRVRAKTDELLSPFLAHLTGSSYGRHYFLMCAKQTTNLASINATQVKAFPLLLPSPDEQQAIIDKVASIDGQIGVEQSHKSKLMKIKSGLMQDLLTGKVRVKVDDAEEVAAHA